MKVIYLFMLYIDGNVDNLSSIFSGAEKISCEKKKLLKSSPTANDILYLIMLHNDGNVDKKFQPSIF